MKYVKKKRNAFYFSMDTRHRSVRIGKNICYSRTATISRYFNIRCNQFHWIISYIYIHIFVFLFFESICVCVCVNSIEFDLTEIIDYSHLCSDEIATTTTTTATSKSTRIYGVEIVTLSLSSATFWTHKVLEMCMRNNIHTHNTKYTLYHLSAVFSCAFVCAIIVC